MGVRRAIVALVVTAALAASCGGASVAATAGGLVGIGSGLEGRPGLEATVFAQGLTHVAAFATDAQGRLWLSTADSTDRGADGVYLVARAGAAPVKVISGLHTPLGLLWFGSTLYVSSTGGVDAYTGFDGSRFAASRDVVTLPAGVGEVNGLAVSPDGVLYLGISAPCDHCTPASMWSATVVSFRPDGTGLQVVARGIRAPVGLEFYPGTSDLLATVDQRDDLGAATPGDGLVLVRPGQTWGFPGCCGQGGAVCTGVGAPTAVLDPHAGVDGLAITTGQLGPAVGTAAIVAEWATGKVQRVVLSRQGAGYTAKVTPFVTGLKNPGPVLLDPTGGLLVGDWTTGVVYRISTTGG